MKKEKQVKCKKCWDKGYHTRIWGGGIVRSYDECPWDVGVKEYRSALQLDIQFCKCKKWSKAKREKLVAQSCAELGIDPKKKI